jgi:exopolysaccharide biosynthesis polyprenyl glycosylphosphotransferase
VNPEQTVPHSSAELLRTPTPRTARFRLGVGLTSAERKLLLAAVDVLLLNAALVLAAIIWIGFEMTPDMIAAYGKWFITLTVLWWIFGTIFDVYNLRLTTNASDALTASGLAALLTTVVYVLIPIVTPAIVSRSYVGGFIILGTGAIMVWRLLYATGFSQPAFQRRVLIAGTGSSAQVLFRELVIARDSGNENPFAGTGYQIVGLLSDTNSDLSSDEVGLPVLGDIDQLVRIARQYNVDEIAVALDEQCVVDPHVYEVLLDCHELGWQLSTLPNLYERLSSRLPVEYAARDLEALSAYNETAGYRLYRAAKRLIDVALALAGMLPLCLLIPFVALGNRLWAPGPLFYRQQRMGRGGRSFAVIKFRSMVVDAEKATGAVWSSNGDSRITPVGSFLRKTRLDELPQILNVLKGEMSMVGPRPERPNFVGRLGLELPVYRARHAVLPGITGWAQIRYRYGNTVEDSRVKLEYDLYYVKHASLYLDLLILLQTVPTMLRFKGQ